MKTVAIERVHLRVFMVPNTSFLRVFLRRSRFIFLLAFLQAVGCLRAQNLEDLPSYRPAELVSGTIRIAGDDYAQSVMQKWIDGFARQQPAVKIEADLQGTNTAMAGIYTSAADMALMGRAPTVSEHDAFYFVFRREPFGIEVMNGSLDVPGKSSALVAFVHHGNPLAKLTLAQLDAIFGTEHRRGLNNIRTWGQLGLTGEWAKEPIDLYVYDADTGTGSYFDRVVLDNSNKWNWERIKEFKDIQRRPNGFEYDASQQILDVLASDRYGLAISSLGYLRPQVKALALAAANGGPYYEATRDNIIQRKYPLSRVITIFINQAPNKPMDPRVKEFLRYILSREGQAAVASEGDYLPLSGETVKEQLEKLDSIQPH